ncbi:MAG: amidohydrolase family protein [Candidatus Latescibacterota bacterium]|nr:amidohydrolase family protein [Candidatus Latescibacterota bacterium]
MAHSTDHRAYTAEWIFDGDRILDDHAVVVDGGTITQVIPLPELPSAIPRCHYPGCTLAPGLIDTHMHFMRWQGPLFLAYGVTTVRDTGNDLQWILQRRREWPHQPWPRILCLGPLLDGSPPGHPLVAQAITSTDSAIAAVRQTAAAQVDGIKLYASIAAEWIAPMVEASHAANLKVSMHCLPHGVLAAGAAGVDEFYHLDGILADVWPDHPSGWLQVWGDPDFGQTWDRQCEVADAIAAMDLTSTPTLAYWDSQSRMRQGTGPYPQERQYLPADLFQWSSATPDAALGATWQRALDSAQRFQGLLVERKVPVLAGSDTPCGGILPGQSLWRELALLVAAGLSPIDALCSATSAAADFLARPDLGRLQKGCVADIAIVRGNPMRSIPEQPEIEQVVRAGIDYQPEELLQAAEPIDPSWRDDPWGRQFAQHWTKRAAARS